MGLIEALEYQIPAPNAAQRAMWHVTSSRSGAWFFAKTAHHLDRVALRSSGGQVALATLVAGIPVLTVQTTGARSGQARTTPLLGVPFGEDIALIGTRFGQPGTPGWYYNMRANPAVTVSYRQKSLPASAREAAGDEWQSIWAAGRAIYGGYEAYARRIRDRAVRIMVLTARPG